jgi:glycosyltransferase involved in cell wall biosynthesis
MADPLLSIVICTFNRAERLADLVTQLLDRQDADFEILVVDDGLTDDTKAVVTAFDDPRVPVFDDFEGLVAAGSFAVRRTAALEAGGFDDDIRCSHQTEFMLRMLPLCTERGWNVVAVPEALLRINWAPPTERGRNNPERLLDCTERLVDVHGDRLRRDPVAYANYAAVCGACCARLGRYSEAHAWFTKAWRSERSLRHLSRTAITWIPPVARRVWSS